jgi:hypothetical protein
MKYFKENIEWGKGTNERVGKSFLKSRSNTASADIHLFFF